MSVDWGKIRNDYVNGGGSYRKLAEKYNVPYPTLRDRAISGEWAKAKKMLRDEAVKIADQKAIEKAADTLAEETEIIFRVRTKSLRLIEKWLDGKEEIEDTGEFRKIVQCCVDLDTSREKRDVEKEDTPDDGFLDALKGEAADTWQD